jgi:hypothetical protein
MTEEKYFYVKKTEIPLYGGVLYVILTNDQERLNKFVSFDEEELYAWAWDQPFRGSLSWFIVLNFDHPTTKVTHGTIGHEAEHSVLSIAEKFGIIPNSENSEPLAYLQEWVENQVYKEIEKRGFTNKITCKK